MNCLICNSENLTRIRTYKHFCFVCNDCNNVFHIKKRNKYLFEWILPRSICQRVLPEKAFLRLFHTKEDYNDANFYSVYAKECQKISDKKKSEFIQLIDTFRINDIHLDGKVVLDISGGPGYICKELNSIGAKCIVTELSEVSTKAMSEFLNIEAIKFDYNSDQLQDLFNIKFDIVMLRSSIIFCENIDQLITSLRTILKPNGYVFLETITPTLGEVLWWQQLEFKFPFIYSQETIEKLFYKHSFSLIYGQRDYESYLKVINRSRKGILPRLFTYIIEYPLVLLYYFLAKKNQISIETNLKHKMLTQIWQKTESTSNVQKKPYRNFHIGHENHSIHFDLIYNNYLK